MRLFKRQKYQMDLSSANETLQSVFAACKQEPNTIPFDKLILRQRARTKPFTIGKYLSILFVILLFIVPFVFPHSKTSISTEPNSLSELSIVNHYTDDDSFTLILSGEKIDFDSCYAVDINNVHYEPVSYNKKENKIVFPYYGEALNIYIYDVNAHSIQVILTPKE